MSKIATSQEDFSVSKESNLDSNLDMNLVLAGFQEKLNVLMTEVIVKDVKIKQLLKIIETLKEKI